MSSLELYYHYLRVWEYRLSVEATAWLREREQYISLLKEELFDDFFTGIEKRPEILSSLFVVNRYQSIQFADDYVLSAQQKSSFCTSLLRGAAFYPYIYSLFNGALFDPLLFANLPKDERYHSLESSFITRLKSMVLVPYFYTNQLHFAVRRP